MSTNHHTPITVGAAANASTFNTRFSDLDAAIDAADAILEAAIESEVDARELLESEVVAARNGQASLDAEITRVDNRVSTIIASSGTSDTEVVDTRGGYTVLSERVDDLEIASGLLKVDAAFNGLSAAKRFTTIAAAMTAATEGCTIEVAPGTYTENVTFSQDNITLKGLGMPHFDGTDLIGGVIIEGQINCNGKIGATVKQLGVDIRANALDDAIIGGSSAGTSPLHQRFENLIVIGKGSVTAGDRGHGILCQSGSYNHITNCVLYYWYHGVALRCSYSTVTGCNFYNCFSDAVIIKSDTGSGDASYCVIANCKSVGTTASAFDRAGPFKVEAVHASFVSRYITISNCVCLNTAEAAVLIQETAGTVANVMVSNVIANGGGDDPSRADFDVLSASDVHFTNCMSASRAAGYGFRVRGTAVRVRAMNCSSDATGAGRSTVADTGTWDYLDLGSGLGVDFARFQHMTFDDPTGTYTIRRAHEMQGGGLATDGVAEDIFTLAWTGTPNTTSVAIELLVTLQSGTLAKIYHYHINVLRPNSSTLVTSQEAIGTAGFTTAGSGDSLVVSVDVATANTAKVRVAGSGGTVAYGYKAIIACMSVGAWTVINNAA